MTESHLHVPTEKQIALYSAVEDIHDLTSAVIVLIVDGDGQLVAISGDENDVPPPLRACLSGKKLAAAGSVRELLRSAGEFDTRLNVTVLDVGSAHVLAILFDVDADFATVQAVGKEARTLIAEILAAD